MITDAIAKLVEGESLTQAEAAATMSDIMEERATAAQFGAFVTALRLKGETAEEIAGMAQVMREKALRVQTDLPVTDTCGTGGDGCGTFNVSTAAALVVAAAGHPVAKHGNRGMSSRCGSADVLEALGVNVTLGPGGGRPLHRGHRDRLHVRPDLPPGDEVRRPLAPGDRDSDRL